MFETASQFFFKLFITLQCHEKLFCTFLAETVHDFEKRSPSSVKFQTFHCSSKISLNLYFHRLLLFKVYKISAKKVQRSYVSWPSRLMQNLKKNWCCFKNDKNLVNFDPSTQKSQNLHFQWFLLCKVFNIWPNKVQRSYLSWHWEWCKIWRKTDLWFGKWHEE